MVTQHNFTSSNYEQDPRWAAVDDYTQQHLHPKSRPNHDALNHALDNSRAHGLPDISTYPALGKFLALQCRIGNVKYALEVGTLGGYTSIWLASQNPEIHITTLEVNPVHAEVARQNAKVAGVSHRVDIIVGPALESFPKLQAEVKSGKRPRFGFVFIDADKLNNWAYFDFAVKMTESGGCIVVDNIVRKGELVSEGARHTDGVRGARQVIEEVGKDERVDAVCLQMVSEKNYDGILMAVVK
jgi:predicted O-methyltransferase YrrM